MVEAFVMVKIEKGEFGSWLKSVAEGIQKIPGVTDVKGVLGRFDLLAKIQANSMEEIVRIVADEIKHTPGVQSTETLVVAF